ncbi:MAG: protein jag [Kiritimatiellia bacterium]
MSGTSQFTETARKELEAILGLMGVEAKVDAFAEAEELYLHIESPDAGRLIGKGAYGLEALQYLLNRILIRKYPEVPHSRVDIERYRERRGDRLRSEAAAAAERVQQTGRPYHFEPLHSFERKIVHQLIKHQEGLASYSEEAASDGRKVLVVCRAGEEPGSNATD